MKTKENLEAELDEIKAKLSKTERDKRNETAQLESEKYLPLIEQAEKTKRDIRLLMDDKYKNELHLLSEEERRLQKEIDLLKVKEANSLWYPTGTIVTLYEKTQLSLIGRTTLTGTVQIYDGSQELPDNMSYYSYPKIGDVVVFHNKKDGAMGKRFDIISSYGRLKNWCPMWLKEGETPENNLYKSQLEKQRKEDES